MCPICLCASFSFPTRTHVQAAFPFPSPTFSAGILLHLTVCYLTHSPSEKRDIAEALCPLRKDCAHISVSSTLTSANTHCSLPTKGRAWVFPCAIMTAALQAYLAFLFTLSYLQLLDRECPWSVSGCFPFFPVLSYSLFACFSADVSFAADFSLLSKHAMLVTIKNFCQQNCLSMDNY